MESLAVALGFVLRTPLLIGFSPEGLISALSLSETGTVWLPRDRSLFRHCSQDFQFTQEWYPLFIASFTCRLFCRLFHAFWSRGCSIRLCLTSRAFCIANLSFSRLHTYMLAGKGEKYGSTGDNHSNWSIPSLGRWWKGQCGGQFDDWGQETIFTLTCRTLILYSKRWQRFGPDFERGIQNRISTRGRRPYPARAYCCLLYLTTSRTRGPDWTFRTLRRALGQTSSFWPSSSTKRSSNNRRRWRIPPQVLWYTVCILCSYTWFTYAS